MGNNPSETAREDGRKAAESGKSVNCGAYYKDQENRAEWEKGWWEYHQGEPAVLE